MSVYGREGERAEEEARRKRWWWWWRRRAVLRSWEKSTMRLSPKVSSAPDFWSLEVEGRGETDAAKPRRSRSESASFACDIGARAHLSFL